MEAKKSVLLSIDWRNVLPSEIAQLEALCDRNGYNAYVSADQVLFTRSFRFVLPVELEGPDYRELLIPSVAKIIQAGKELVPLKTPERENRQVPVSFEWVGVDWRECAENEVLRERLLARICGVIEFARAQDSPRLYACIVGFILKVSGEPFKTSKGEAVEFRCFDQEPSVDMARRVIEAGVKLQEDGE